MHVAYITYFYYKKIVNGDRNRRMVTIEYKHSKGQGCARHSAGNVMRSECVTDMKIKNS